MNKKTFLKDLDIPQDDDDCWVRYPKHRWVYEATRLLDSQNIHWSLSQTELENCAIKNINLKSKNSYHPGQIYIKTQEGRQLFTEVFIVRGEIKHIRHIDPSSGEVLKELIGEIELRINAFVTLHFQKFTGIITTETFSNDIYRIQLRPQSDLGQESNSEIIRLLKRIYKKSDITINGLTDRVFHETLAS